MLGNVQYQPIIKGMTSTNNTESIEKELLRLEPEARAQLVHTLVKSLGNLSESKIQSLWLDEAERRDAELESGSVEAVSGDEVLNRIRNRHGFLRHGATRYIIEPLLTSSEYLWWRTKTPAVLLA